MYPAPELFHQFIHDRQQDRRAAAAAHRLAASSPARSSIARTLRRAADRLDAATSPSAVRGALRRARLGIRGGLSPRPPAGPSAP